MQCSGCNERKLSHEFPRGQATSSCNHLPHCLRCVLSAYKLNKSCPVCSEEIEATEHDALCARLAAITHEDLFYTPSIPALIAAVNVPRSFTIFVSTLTGDHKEITVSNEYMGSHLRLLIQREFGLAPEYQRLFFNGKELDLHTKLTNAGISPNSRVQVQQVLLALKSHSKLNNIEFVLSWTYTTVAPSYLNGTCFAYGGDQYFGFADFQNPHPFEGLLHHGKAALNSRIKAGRQAFSVELAHVHPTITHLYFVLSVCKTRSLASFVSPTVNMYDAVDPNTSLSDYKISTARNSQAVVMCCLRRDVVQGWIVIAIGKNSRGRVHNYNPILGTISTLYE